MGRHLQRALVLMQQERPELAEKELRAELAEEPDSPESHALLSHCLLAREQFNEATEEAKAAIRSAPDADFAHRALARVMLARNRPAEAKAAVEEAIRLDPEEADSFGLLAGIEFERRDWPAALAAAEQGLAVDPEHIGCNNLRAMALVKLGRREEAGATIDAALSRNPEDALTHSNRGWTLLEQRDPTKALEHFREALRLDPTSEWARLGVVEALKARNIIYGLMLRYFLWMGRLSGTLQWVVILAVFLGPRLLRSAEQSFPALGPFVLPITILLGVFAVMTWVADSLFNMLLRFNRFGRMALSDEQITASNWVAGCLGLALAFLGAWLAGVGGGALLAALMIGVLVLPLSACFKTPEGWPRTTLTCITGALGMLAATTIFLVFRDNPEDAKTIEGMIPMYFWGNLAAQFIANGLMSVRVTR